MATEIEYRDTYDRFETIEHLLMRYGVVPIYANGITSHVTKIGIPYIKEKISYPLCTKEIIIGKWFWKRKTVDYYIDNNNPTVEYLVRYNIVGTLKYNKGSDSGVKIYCYDSEIYDYIADLDSDNIELFMQAK